MNWLKTKLVKINVIETVDTSDLVREAGYNTKIAEVEKEISDHGKYIITPEFNKLTAEIWLKDFPERLIKAKLANKWHS